MSATQALAAVTFACLALVAYAYLGYPVLLAVVAWIAQLKSDLAFVIAKRDRRRTRTDELPLVAVVISAYNEERHIEQRMLNLLSLDYPASQLRIYVGSDGSRDRTAELLARFSDARVHCHVFEHNRGKANVLNDLVSRTSEPILVFSDANTQFRADALRQLVAPFSEPEVGGVSGELQLRSSGGANEDSLYWRMEQVLKFFEARIGALLGANGAIFAIRREHWRSLPPDTICDDFCIGMNVAAKGKRLVYAPGAIAEEDTPAAIGEEVHRRIRIGIGNFQALTRCPEYLFRTSLATAFAYFSHKVLRWIAPHLLVIALVGSAILAGGSVAWRWVTLVQIVVYAASAASYRVSERGVPLPKLGRVVALLFALNWAFLIASWRFALGRYGATWRTSQR